MLSLLVGIVIVAIILAILWVILGMLPLPANVKLVIELVFLLLCVLALFNYLPLGVPRGRLF